MEPIQNALNVVCNWSSDRGLDIGPSTIVIGPFNKRKKPNYITPKIDRININSSTMVKDLGCGWEANSR